MSFFDEPHIPAREAVAMLIKGLGAGIDWGYWLQDNRRYRNAPFISFRRYGGRVYYRLADIREFIREKGGSI